MGIRETLNEHPRASMTIVLGLVLLLMGFLAWSLRGGESEQEVSAVASAYYSTDDGQSWFVDDRAKIPPFEHQGKPAYRAYVFKCGESGKPFVAYLERFAEPARTELANRNRGAPSRGAGGGAALNDAIEVKQPGAGEWVKLTSAGGARAVAPRCADGARGVPQPVLP